MGHLKFCLFSRMARFYLGRGATWVHVAVKRRIYLSFAGFAVLYLCFSGTWVHVAV